jgi:hypothetical protein
MTLDSGPLTASPSAAAASSLVRSEHAVPAAGAAPLACAGAAAATGAASDPIASNAASTITANPAVLDMSPPLDDSTAFIAKSSAA